MRSRRCNLSFYLSKRRNPILATFLADYENVAMIDGLKGVEYLNENDRIIIFYSEHCPKIRYDELKSIINSKCEFITYKLKQSYKNGLDFYIATETGALIDQGERQLAIISRDKGYMAVIDFLKIKYGAEDISLCKAHNLENAISNLNDANNKARRSLLKDNMRLLDIEIEYAKYEERNKYKQHIKDILKGTEFELMSNDIISYVFATDITQKRTLYTGALRQFGKVNGTNIYRLLKEVI